MSKQITISMHDGAVDPLGNDKNRECSVVFENGDSFITMTFGGRDGSSNDFITLDELRAVLERLS